METRKTRGNFYINDALINEILDPYIKTLKYSDSLEGESDTLELTLRDDDQRFLRGLVPARGTSVRVELVKENWSDTLIDVLPLGVFEVDEFTNKYPPTECVLKLNSVPNSAKVRRVEKNRSWENVSLKKIAQDIATGAGLKLFYDVEEIEVSRVEQSGESDLQLLSKICGNHGLNLKVSDRKLIIFDATTYENKTPVFALEYGAANILSFNGSATLNQIYADAKVSFKGGASSFLGGLFSSLGLEGLLEATSGLKLKSASDNILAINQKVSSVTEAERLARKKLREKNQKEWQVDLALTGSFEYLSGNVFMLKDFGVYDGNYLIERADHNVDQNGYVTSISAHKCLDY